MYYYYHIAHGCTNYLLLITDYLAQGSSDMILIQQLLIPYNLIFLSLYRITSYIIIKLYMLINL